MLNSRRLASVANLGHTGRNICLGHTTPILKTNRHGTSPRSEKNGACGTRTQSHTRPSRRQPAAIHPVACQILPSPPPWSSKNLLYSCTAVQGWLFSRALRAVLFRSLVHSFGLAVRRLADPAQQLIQQYFIWCHFSLAHSCSLAVLRLDDPV